MFKLFICLLLASLELNVVLSDGLIEVFSWKQIDYVNRGNNDQFSNLQQQPVNLNSAPVDRSQPKDFIFPDQLQRKTSYRNRNKRDNNAKTSRDDPLVTESRWTFKSDIGGNSNRNMNTSSYIAYNNVPMGATHYRGRLFITIPRRRIGIPSTLNYIDLRKDGGQQSPKLRAYPDFETNDLKTNLEPSPNRFVSVYRTSVDACQRLWFIDTGMLEYPDNRMQIQRPSIWIVDLKTDRRIRRFEIPESIVSTGRGLASITVDVKPNRCGQAFAYIPDLVNRLLFVYSFEENRIWTFSHNYFSFDPLAGDLTIGGQSFQWDDGIFSITLGPAIANGYNEVFFHAMASNNEFVVTSQILQNETKAQAADYENDFRLMGSRGERRQSTMHHYDTKSGVIFYAEIQRNAVGCWNINKRFSPRTHGTVQADGERMIYPSDLTVDEEDNIWIMTNSMPIFIYSNLNPDEINFRVWRQNVFKAIENTVCA